MGGMRTLLHVAEQESGAVCEPSSEDVVAELGSSRLLLVSSGVNWLMSEGRQLILLT